VRGSARYPPIFSHFFCASSQDELTAVSRNLKQPSADASSQSPVKLWKEDEGERQVGPLQVHVFSSSQARKPTVSIDPIADSAKFHTPQE
jgi:hypothetical protein